MLHDPILQEIRENRDALAARFHYNVYELGQYLQRLEQTSDKTYTSYPPKPAPSPGKIKAVK